MGNKESANQQGSGKLIRRSSSRRRTHSPSSARARSESITHPQSSRKLSSFRKEEEAEPAIVSINKNRSKSFRASTGQPRYMNGDRRKSNICETTGLSTHQKVLLSTTWRQLPRGLVFELGKRVFETIFERDPNLLVVVGLEHLQDSDEWREHVNFRMHAQRFTHTLSQCMRNLAEPIVAADRLQEFGAAYANQEDIEYGGINAHIPHSYWDRLTAAITSTAKEFLEKQQRKGTKKTLTVNDALPENERMDFLSQDSANISAWSALAVFVSNQIRFGYEMERMLRAELKKLGLNSDRKTS